MVYGIVKGNPVLIKDWLFLWKLCMIFYLPFIIYEASKLVVIIFSIKAQLVINWRFTTQYLFLLITGEWANQIYESLKNIPFQPGQSILIRLDNQEKGSSSEPTKKFTCKV